MHSVRSRHAFLLWVDLSPEWALWIGNAFGELQYTGIRSLLSGINTLWRLTPPPHTHTEGWFEGSASWPSPLPLPYCSPELLSCFPLLIWIPSAILRSSHFPYLLVHPMCFLSSSEPSEPPSIRGSSSFSESDGFPPSEPLHLMLPWTGKIIFNSATLIPDSGFPCAGRLVFSSSLCPLW